MDALADAKSANVALDALERLSEKTNDPAYLDTQPKIVDAVCKVLARVRSRPDDCNARPFMHSWLRFTDADTRAKVMHTFGE